MDYIFVVIPMTRDAVKRRYGVDVKGASETESETRENTETTEDVVSVIKQYYKNDDGTIGLFTWCDDFILEDMKDYQARRLEVCKKCGRVKIGDVSECGSKSFETKTDDYEELTEDIKQYDGNVIPSVSGTEMRFALDEDGNGILDDKGMPVMEEIGVRTKIPETVIAAPTLSAATSL